MKETRPQQIKLQIKFEILDYSRSGYCISNCFNTLAVCLET